MEDEAIVALHEQKTLEKYGYRVVSVQTGEQAVDAVAKDDEIELVLMDIDRGPGMPGDEAAERILEMRHIPIVFLTSHAEREYVERVKQITRYGYVLKHSGEFVLWNTIEVAFELFETHKRYEEKNDELLAANERLERFFSVNLDLLCIADTDGNFIKVNTEWEEILGYPAEELQQSRFLDFVHPEDIEATLAAIEQLKSQNDVINFVNRYRTKDGSYRFIEWRSHPVGNLIYGAARDITERKELERHLRHYEQAVNSVEEGIVAVDTAGYYALANTAFLKRHGLKREQVIGHHAREILGAEAYDNYVRDKLSTCLQGRSVTYDMKFDYGEGEPRSIRVSYYPIEEYAEVRGVVGVIEDVSEYVEVQEELAHRSIRSRWLSEIAGRLLSGLSVDEILRHTVEEISRGFPDYRVAYSTVSSDGTLTVLASTEPEGMPDLEGVVADLKSAPGYLHALLQNEPVKVEDVAKEEADSKE